MIAQLLCAPVEAGYGTFAEVANQWTADDLVAVLLRMRDRATEARRQQAEQRARQRR